MFTWLEFNYFPKFAIAINDLQSKSIIGHTHSLFITKVINCAYKMPIVYQVRVRSRTPLHISINVRFVAVTQFRLLWFASLSNRQHEHHLPLLFTLHDLRMAHMRERVLCASPSSSLTKTICPKTAFIRASLTIVEGAASSLLYVCSTAKTVW